MSRSATAPEQLVMRSTLASLALFVLGCSSGSPRPPFHAAGPPALPGCFDGPFAREAESLLPSLAPKVLVELGSPSGLDALTEPGCTPPFRDDPKNLGKLEVARVEGYTLSREGARRLLLGRGKMTIAHRYLDLELHDDSAETTLQLEIRDRHVKMSGKRVPNFDEEIDASASTPLPLPVDALVEALARCDGDKRLLRSEDGNIVKARRDDHTIWRTRWVDVGGNALVDTSSMCDDQDARMVWRSAMGDAGPLIGTASVRSAVAFTITVHGASRTDPAESTGITR